MKETSIKWPDNEERKKIAARIWAKYKWPNCIAIADGTLFPLTYAPQSVDAPDYNGRKHPYSLTCMIVNDDQKRIRYYLSGFPGCAHDNRVYANTPLAKQPDNYFEDKYYLLADSAIQNSPSVVSSFKAPKGHDLESDLVKFNTHLGKVRVSSEHTIGILKGRFPWLRSIPMVISDNAKSLKNVLRHIDCCMILHNLLMDLNDKPPEYYKSDDSDTDGGYDSDLDSPIHPGAAKDERRQKLLHYFKEYVF